MGRDKFKEILAKSNTKNPTLADVTDEEFYKYQVVKEGVTQDTENILESIEKFHTKKVSKPSKGGCPMPDLSLNAKPLRVDSADAMAEFCVRFLDGDHSTKLTEAKTWPDVENQNAGHTFDLVRG